jgi:hypothetical protein
MDNGSDDLTYEILKELQKDYDIDLIRDPSPYAQSKFMTKLTKLAKKYSPKWVINSDADEFWVGDIKKLNTQKGSVLKIKRFNMLIYKGLKNWKESEYMVINPILNQVGEINTLLGKIGRKVIVNPFGYIKTNSGNHSAEHLFFWKNREWDGLKIYHYPIRSFEQFKKNIENRVKLLDMGAKMGAHYKRWAKIYKEGNLEKEYEKMLLQESEIECLIKQNIVAKVKIIFE